MREIQRQRNPEIKAAVLNAANEVAVELFLQDRIGFLGMTDVIATVLGAASFIRDPDLHALEASDAEARTLARKVATTHTISIAK